MAGQGKGPAAVVRVRLDTREANAQAGRFSKDLGNTLGKGSNAATKLSSGLAGAATAAATLGAVVARAAMSSVEAWSRVEKSIAEVQTISDPVAFSVGRVTEETQRLARAHGIGTQTQVKALYQAISAGITDSEKAFKFLGVANRLAVGGLTDTATAVDGLTSVLNAFKLETGQAEKVSDSLFVAVQQGKTRMEDLAGSIGQVASIAAQSGLSFQEMNAAIATITTNGVSTSEAVTQLRSLLVAVAKASDETKKAASALGIEFSVSALKAQGYKQFLLNLSEATNNNQETLNKLLGRTEAVAAVLNQASDGGQKFTETLDKMTEQQGQTAAAAERMGETLDNQVSRIREHISTVSESIGAALKASDTMSNMLEALEGAVKSASATPANPEKVVTWWKKLDWAIAGAAKSMKEFGKQAKDRSRKSPMEELSKEATGPLPASSEFPMDDFEAMFGKEKAREQRRRIHEREMLALEKSATAYGPDVPEPARRSRHRDTVKAQAAEAAEKERIAKEAEKAAKLRRDNEAREVQRWQEEMKAGALAYERGLAKLKQDAAEERVALAAKEMEKEHDLRVDAAERILDAQERLAARELEVIEDRETRKRDLLARMDKMSNASVKLLADQQEAEVKILEASQEKTISLLRSVTDAIGSAIADGAKMIARGEFTIGRFLGNIVSMIGESLIGMGSAAIAAGILGTIVPFLAGPTGGPGGIAAGVAAVGAGTALLAMGSVMGGMGTGAASSAVPATRSPASVSTSGFDSGAQSRQPDTGILGSSGPVTNIYEVHLNGPIGGSARAIRSDLKRLMMENSLSVSGG